MEIRHKIWIEVEGAPAFGSGRKALLEAIDRYGSITQAAREMGISYRKAWSYVNAMEVRLGLRLVERRTGGKHGGGASITPEARLFLRQYARMEDGIQSLIDTRFRKVFGSQDRRP